MTGIIERLYNAIDDLKERVVDAADDRDGEFLGYPRAFAWAMDLIYTKATSLSVKFLSEHELTTAAPAEINKMIQVVEGCIADQHK